MEKLRTPLPANRRRTENAINLIYPNGPSRPDSFVPLFDTEPITVTFREFKLHDNARAFVTPEGERFFHDNQGIGTKLLHFKTMYRAFEADDFKINTSIYVPDGAQDGKVVVKDEVYQKPLSLLAKNMVLREICRRKMPPCFRMPDYYGIVTQDINGTSGSFEIMERLRGTSMPAHEHDPRFSFEQRMQNHTVFNDLRNRFARQVNLWFCPEQPFLDNHIGNHIIDFNHPASGYPFTIWAFDL